MLCLLTGLRRTDCATIRWGDLDLGGATLRRPNPKGGEKKAFVLPLSNLMVEILLQRRDENSVLFGSPTDWVFPTRGRDGAVKPIQEPKERGLPTPHRLRDTYTTAANACGLSVYDIEVLTNHRPAKSSVTAGYIRQDLDHLRIGQQRITDHLRALMWPEPDGDVVNLEAARAKRQG